MSAVVRELGRFTTAEDVDCIAGVLQRWLTLLEYDLSQVCIASGPLQTHLPHAHAMA